MKAKLKVIEGHLMTGISYILPVIIGASLIVGLAKLVGLGFGVSDLNAYKDAGGIYAADLMEQVGWTGIGLMNVLLAGFIAYSIADKSGLSAGFIGGALASSTNAGFIGAVIAGFFAGYVALFVKRKIQIKGSAAGLVPAYLTAHYLWLNWTSHVRSAGRAIRRFEHGNQSKDQRYGR